MYRDLSTSSVDEENSNSISSNQISRQLKQFSRSLLRGTIFQGSFQEKRYVTAIKAYRSVIMINPDEKPLIRNLIEIKKRIRQANSSPDYWIGITEPNTVGAPSGYCLWVNLTEEILGQFWFNIRTLEITDKEARIRLAKIKPVVEEIKTTQTVRSPDQSVSELITSFFDDSIKPTMSQCSTDLGKTLKILFTYENIRSAIVFFSVAVMALATGLFHATKYLFEFSLRFMREVSMFLKSISPIVESLTGVVKYFIHGLFWCIVSLFSSNSNKNLPNQNVYPQHRQNMIQYPRGNNWKTRGLPPTNYSNRKQYGQVYIEEIDS